MVPLEYSTSIAAQAKRTDSHRPGDSEIEMDVGWSRVVCISSLYVGGCEVVRRKNGKGLLSSSLPKLVPMSHPCGDSSVASTHCSLNNCALEFLGCYRSGRVMIRTAIPDIFVLLVLILHRICTNPPGYLSLARCETMTSPPTH